MNQQISNNNNYFYDYHQQNEHDDDEDYLTGQQRKRKSSRSGTTLSAELKMRLIDLVRERPQIWNSYSEGFRNNQIRQAAFNEVALLLSSDEEAYTRIQIQEEWGKLRYCYWRIVKKLMEESGGQITENQFESITWPYCNPMAFLLDAVKAQLGNQNSTESYVTNAQENVNSDGTSEFYIGNDLQKPSNKHRKRRIHTTRKPIQESQEQESFNSSSNELLSQAIEIASDELLMANFLAFSNSQKLLGKLQHHDDIVHINNDSGERTVTLEKNRAHFENNNIFRKQQGQDVITPQHFEEYNEHSASSSVNDVQRRKRKSSTLDLLMKTTFANYDEQQSESLHENTANAPSNSRITNFPMESHSKGQDLHSRQKETDRAIIQDINYKCEDINESFGRCIIQQLQSVAKKSAKMCIQMRKELMEVCFKFELESCKTADPREHCDSQT